MANPDDLRRWLEHVKANRPTPQPEPKHETAEPLVHMVDLIPDPEEFVRHLRTYAGRRFLTGLATGGTMTCPGCMAGLQDHLAMPIPGVRLN